ALRLRVGLPDRAQRAPAGRRAGPARARGRARRPVRGGTGAPAGPVQAGAGGPRPRTAHRHRAGHGRPGPQVAQHQGVVGLPAADAAAPGVPAVRRLLPVRAERAEADAAADDHAGRGPPHVRDPGRGPAGAPVQPAAGRRGVAGAFLRQAAPVGAGRWAMNILNANFDELYERHLCRHSQFGINVQHLAGMTATYLALFGIAWWVAESGLSLLGVPEPTRVWLRWLMMVAIPAPYLAAIA